MTGITMSNALYNMLYNAIKPTCSIVAIVEYDNDYGYLAVTIINFFNKTMKIVKVNDYNELKEVLKKYCGRCQVFVFRNNNLVEVGMLNPLVYNHSDDRYHYSKELEEQQIEFITNKIMDHLGNV